MRSLVILFACVFSFLYIDLKLFRRNQYYSFETVSISFEISDRKEKLKQKRRKYKNRKYKKRKFYQQRHYKLQGTNAKDNRYSNQKDIRRMHTSYA
jgi:hypothetical protein